MQLELVVVLSPAAPAATAVRHAEVVAAVKRQAQPGRRGRVRNLLGRREAGPFSADDVSIRFASLPASLVPITLGDVVEIRGGRFVVHRPVAAVSAAAAGCAVQFELVIGCAAAPAAPTVRQAEIVAAVQRQAQPSRRRWRTCRVRRVFIAFMIRLSLYTVLLCRRRLV